MDSASVGRISFLVVVSLVAAGCVSSPPAPATGEVDAPGVVLAIGAAPPPSFDLSFERNVTRALLDLAQDARSRIPSTEFVEVAAASHNMMGNAIALGEAELAGGLFPLMQSHAVEAHWRAHMLAARLATLPANGQRASAQENVTSLREALADAAGEMNETRAQIGGVFWPPLVRAEMRLVEAYFYYEVFIDRMHREPGPDADARLIARNAAGDATWTRTFVDLARIEHDEARKMLASGALVDPEAVVDAGSLADHVARALAEARSLNKTASSRDFASVYGRATGSWQKNLRIAESLGWSDAQWQVASEISAFARAQRALMNGTAPSSDAFNATWTAAMRAVEDPLDARVYALAAHYRDDYVRSRDFDLPNPLEFAIEAWSLVSSVREIKAARPRAAAG